MEEVKVSDEQYSDVEKLFAFLSYVFFFGILVYRTKKDSAYVVEHAKQGIVLFGLSLTNFILMAIPILGWMLVPFLNLALMVLFVIGANNALSGKKVSLPIVGGLSSIIK